eukprot:scaffold4223_cov189-Amphora_coffeaeformis.AAC.15
MRQLLPEDGPDGSLVVVQTEPSSASYFASWTQETFEASECASPLAFGQDGGRVGPQALGWPAQDARVSAGLHHAP